jgi:putative peptidoglycan lipid II flippase
MSDQTAVNAARTGKSLLKSASVVGAWTLLSRVIGLARDVVIAVVFGAGMATDAFFVAFRIPNFFRRMFAEGAFAQAFVPVLAEYKAKKSLGEVRELIANTTGWLSLVLCVLTLFAIVFANQVVWLFAPGFSQSTEKMLLAGHLLGWTFPYLPCLALVALCGAVLNTYQHFSMPAFAPVLLNVCMIAAALGVAPLLPQPIMALAWGVLAAGILQLLIQLPVLKSKNLLVWPQLNFQHAGVKRVALLMVPALFGASVTQINLLFNSIMASFLGEGSVSWLYYADRLMELPLGVFGIAIGTVLLPKLSQDHVEASPQAFSQTLDWSLRWVLMIGIPAALALVILSEPIMASLFYYKNFQQEDVQQAARALQAYGPAIAAFMMIKVLAPGFYAREDLKTPVRIGVCAVVTNVVVSLLLIRSFAHVGLAWATSAAALFNAVSLGWLLYRRKIWLLSTDWWRFLGKITVAVMVMIAVVVGMSPERNFWFEASLWQRAGQLTLMIMGGAGGYGLMLLLLRIRQQVSGVRLTRSEG